MIYKPYSYQQYATGHIIEHPYCGLFLEMGLGKTVSTLTAVDLLKNDYFTITKVLVVAPKRVAEDTWTTEVAKWDHLKHLRISRVLGSEAQRKAALKAKADVYVINRENVAWLVGLYGTGFPFDMVILDESSSFKSPKAIRFRALKQVRPLIKRVVLLTGTPRPNTLMDLWPQLYLLDMGERLGKTITGYREKYFKPGKRNGHVVYNYELKGKEVDPLIGNDVYEQEIYQKIGDICVSMKARDYLVLPERVDISIPVHLSDKSRQLYNEFERRQVLALEEKEISAVNAAALSTKLLQFAGGAVYNAEKDYHEVHQDKLEALEELIENANGEPVLVGYWYQHEAERIKKYLKHYKPRELKGQQDIKDWNDGKIQVMLAHPASAGHGINLQYGGNIIAWYSNTWSLELYQQFVARLDRQGQVKPVRNYRLVAQGTIDEDVIAAQELKAAGQEALMQAVKARIHKYRNAA